MKALMFSAPDFLRFDSVESFFHFSQPILRQVFDGQGKEHIVLFFDMELQQFNVIIRMPFKPAGGIAITVFVVI